MAGSYKQQTDAPILKPGRTPERTPDESQGTLIAGEGEFIVRP
jgi:hypothetical protein